MLRVRHSLQWIDGERKLVAPKMPRCKRTIPMAPITVDALQRHRTAQNRSRLANSDAWNELDFVFTTGIGTPLDGAEVTLGFQRLLTAANLRRDASTI